MNDDLYEVFICRAVLLMFHEFYVSPALSTLLLSHSYTLEPGDEYFRNERSQYEGIHEIIDRSTARVCAADTIYRG
jgi:hypothetical protein